MAMSAWYRICRWRCLAAELLRWNAGLFSLTIPLHRVGHSKRQFPLPAGVALVGTHHPLHQLVPHHISLLEITEVDSVDILQDFNRFHQARLARVWQIDLRDVSGNDGL